MEESDTRLFTYQEIFDKFPDVANGVYCKPTEAAYRIVHNPATSADFLPKAVQQNEDSVPEVDLSQYGDDTPVEVQEELAKKYGVSHYYKEKKLTVRYSKIVKSAVRAGGVEAGEAIKKRLGTFYVKVNYEKTDGKMSRHGSDGHENVALYNDVNPLDRIDKEFGYKEITFDEDI
jgi:hypothetical protein